MLHQIKLLKLVKYREEDYQVKTMISKLLVNSIDSK
jgi:hypothetical protein